MNRVQGMQDSLIYEQEIREVDNHFSRIAPLYRTLRTTDTEPIKLIASKLKAVPKIAAADLGCGTGRYDLKLFQTFRDRLTLHCMDLNAQMLMELRHCLEKNRIKNFSTLLSSAEQVPMADASLDAIVTFNAVHHFDLPRFLAESSRLLRPGGYIFVYTRLQEQNAKNIWGSYFPGFTQKETRLIANGEMERALWTLPELKLATVEEFRYSRGASLERLKEQATQGHYSTFNLYDEAEFARALMKFERKIRLEFSDPDQIFWYDENVMFVVYKMY